MSTRSATHQMVAVSLRDRGTRLCVYGQWIHQRFVRVSSEGTVCFSPDGNSLVSGGKDKSIRIWSTSAALNVRTLRGHTDKVYCTSFSPNGNNVASGSADGVRIWSLLTGACEVFLTTHSGEVFAVSFSNDGSRLAWVRRIAQFEYGCYRRKLVFIL